MNNSLVPGPTVEEILRDKRIISIMPWQGQLLIIGPALEIMARLQPEELAQYLPHQHEQDRIAAFAGLRRKWGSERQQSQEERSRAIHRQQSLKGLDLDFKL